MEYVIRYLVGCGFCYASVQRNVAGGILFLRATAYAVSAHMLSQFRPSVRLSVRLSVTRVIHAKTVVVRIVQFSPYSSPIPLVFAR